MRRRSHVWIVEMENDGLWEPTIGAALSRDNAGLVIADWREMNPDDSFRITKYVRHEKAGK